MVFNRRLLRACIPVGISLVAASCCTSVFGQGVGESSSASILAKRVTLSTVQLADFNLGLAAIAEQAKIVIAVEGKPLHRVLTPERMRVAGPVPETMSLQEAIVRIADMHGYSVAKWRNAFALSKRYDEARDLPCATLEEMTASMDDVVRILKPYGYHGLRDSELMAEIFEGLSADQIRQLPKRSLTVRSLNEQERVLVNQSAIRVYAGSRSQQAEDVARRLHHIAGSSLGLVAHVDAAPLGQAQPGGILLRLEGEALPEQIGRYVIGDADPVVNLANEKVIVDALSKSIREHAPADPGDATIETLVSQLNIKGPEHFSVDPELKLRQASLFGMANTTEDAAARALIFACGLSLRSEGHGATYSISRPRALAPTSIVDLPTAVRRALPVTFLRACGVTGVQTSITFATIPLKKQWLSANGISPRGVIVAANSQQMNLGWQLQAAATERIKAALLVLQKSNSSAPKSDTPVKDSELDAETRGALGALALTEFVGRLDEVMPIKQQEFISRFDDDILGGGLRIDKQGRRKLDLEFLVVASGGGGMFMQGAMGDVLAPASLPTDGPAGQGAK